LVSPLRSQMKTSLCDNQHNAAVGILEEYPKRTGLPREEYFDHLQAPDPNWLKTIKVLLTVGENDKGHWVKGDRLQDKREMFIGAKYAAITRGAHVVLIPRYGHVGYAELYNEKIAYLWLLALKEGYFASYFGSNPSKKRNAITRWPERSSTSLWLSDVTDIYGLRQLLMNV